MMKRRKHRSGVILAAVLVSLVAVIMIGGTLVQTLVLHHREVRRTEQSQQSFWLAESAVQRAVYRLAASPDYEGETWRVESGVLGGTSGLAIIRVEQLAEAPAVRRIVVEAHYPEAPPGRVLHRREWNVQLPSDSGGSS